MKKKLAMWVIGGIVTASTLGLGFNATVASAAEKEVVKPAMQGMVMQCDNKMGAMDPNAMKKKGDMQKKCMEMMNNPKMQGMMKNPEMQAKMQDMMKETMKTLIVKPS